MTNWLIICESKSFKDTVYKESKDNTSLPFVQQTLRKRLGTKFKDGICADLHLKFWLECEWYFCSISESGQFLKSIVQEQISKQSLPKVSLKKVTIQNSIAELWTVISNQMINYHLLDTSFNTSLHNQKYNVGQFLLKRFVDLIRV